MGNKKFLLMIVTVFCAMVTGVFGAGSDVLSNGLLEIRIDAEKGSYDVIDLKRNQPIVSDSQIGFSVAPYVELSDVGAEDVETSPKSVDYSSSGGVCRGGESGSLIFRQEGVGELEVNFQLRPGSAVATLGFSFRNLGSKPVRLRRVNVLTGRFMESLGRKNLQMLNGDSGWSKTEVCKPPLKAENNMLCFFGDPGRTRSLVVGGLTYADFRKFVNAAEMSLDVYADDPVGKRIDPGALYNSADRFYIDGATDDPFEALEAYAKATEIARNINIHYYTFPSVCMWFLGVDVFSGQTKSSSNDSVGAVEEMQRIADSGFLKYSPVAVRLVPDNYEQNNQQGWWDDEHWQMYGRKERCIVDRHYEKPYETTKKWTSAVRQLGGIATTYFQPGVRSEDYAKAFPGHMLYNQSQKLRLKKGKAVYHPHAVIGAGKFHNFSDPANPHRGYGKLLAETYDFTDPEFLAHWKEVNRILKNDGMQGVFYDYPSYAYAKRGGFEDRYATATHAYLNVFRIARAQQGKDAYLQERLGIGSDATLEFVSSVRTQGDTNIVNPEMASRAAMRWYKNRRLTNFDLDGKAMLEIVHGKNSRKLSATERRAILTVSYAVSGRLLLTESFHRFTDEVLSDLSRIYPFHATTLSARPLDAFISSPASVFDFPISSSWHQVVLYNGPKDDREFEIPISGDTAFGALGLKANRQYYVYDFWNDRFVGKVSGNASIKQAVAAGEARMLSVHAVEHNPQWISTDRHVMQGYVDMVKRPEWSASDNTLSGTSSVIGGEPYCITLARNGYSVKMVTANGAAADIKIHPDNENLADVVLKAKENQDVLWEIMFSK